MIFPLYFSFLFCGLLLVFSFVDLLSFLFPFKIHTPRSFLFLPISPINIFFHLRYILCSSFMYIIYLHDPFYDMTKHLLQLTFLVLIYFLIMLSHGLLYIPLLFLFPFFYSFKTLLDTTRNLKRLFLYLRSSSCNFAAVSCIYRCTVSVSIWFLFLWKKRPIHSTHSSFLGEPIRLVHYR